MASSPVQARRVDDIPSSVFSPGGTALHVYEEYSAENSPPARSRAPSAPQRERKYNPSMRSPACRHARARKRGARCCVSMWKWTFATGQESALVTIALRCAGWLVGECRVTRPIIVKRIIADEAGWRIAEYKEFRAHRRNKSWSELNACDLPKGRRLVRMTWGYKTKRNGTLTESTTLRAMFFPSARDRF